MAALHRRPSFADMEQLVKNNAALVLDLLLGRLAFERTGVKLYDSVIHKIERGAEPRYHRLLDQLHHIRDEEKEHEEWLEAQIRALGGTAHETSDMSMLEVEESAGIKNVIVDGHQKVLHLLHALLAAELADNAGWDLLVKLADDAGDRAAKLELGKRLAQEVQHLAFIREAVVRAAEIEILGFHTELPSGMAGVMAGTLKKPLALGALFGVACLGAGASIAYGLMKLRQE